jgi:hypothetical protein
MSNEPSECDIAFTIDQPNAVQNEILQLCKDLSIEKHHAAILVDADMAIDWSTYFDKAHGGTKLVSVLVVSSCSMPRTYPDVVGVVQGTEAFMSRWLLDPVLSDHIHSPLDDYWSFYFVAQWACVFSPLSLKDVQDSRIIQRWRSWLDGLRTERETATTAITKDSMSANKHGEFLRQAQPFLEAWIESLHLLGRQWVDASESLKHEVFSEFADRGLLSFLKVAHRFLQSTPSTG